MASVMQKANTLRAALGRGNGLSFGAWQMLPGAHLSRTMARSGFDWILIDCEHGNIAGIVRHILALVANLTNWQTTRCTSLYMQWPPAE